MNIAPSLRRLSTSPRGIHWLFRTAHLLALATWLFGRAPSVHAAVAPPEHMSYQGFLVDGSGNPLAPSTPGNYTVVFRIYDEADAGHVIWSEQQVVTVDKGNFSVVLGEGSAYSSEPHGALSQVFSSNTASSRHLGITVTVGGTPITLAPRLRLLPSPYAFLATQATKLVNPSTGEAFLTESGGNVSVTGTVHAGTIAGESLSATGGIGVHGASALEFGVGVAGKDAHAGRMGYQTLTAGALDIVGAGTSGSNRRIKFWNEGGADFTGSATVQGTVTAATFVGNGTIPVGGIIMWSGAVNTVPSGWALCNGQTVSGRATPDLRDRFIVGAGSTYTVGTTGGASSFYLQDAQVPLRAHKHTHQDRFDTDNGGFSIWSAGDDSEGGGDDSGLRRKYFDTETGTTGLPATQPVDNRPPYYALAFIMRVQ